MEGRRLEVGFLGAGPVTQAIHLPALATQPARFKVRWVMDVDAELADSVARRCGAKGTTSLEAVTGDPAVDVIAICSPNSFHASQVLAGCNAGKRAILCEKPLAVTTDEADAIAAAATGSGTHLVVGTMHVYDPACQAAIATWRDLGESVSLVKSTILIPPNDVFVNQATTLAKPPIPPPVPPPGAEADPAFQAFVLRLAVLGLTSHNLPLIRALGSPTGEVKTAHWLPPFGYAIVAGDGNVTVELLAYFGGAWPPSWTLEAFGATHELRITFPPSYVLAGSCQAEIRGCGTSQGFHQKLGGYETEWSHLYDVVCNGAEPLVPVDEAVADLKFALGLADAIGDALGVSK